MEYSRRKFISFLGKAGLGTTIIPSFLTSCGKDETVISPPVQEKDYHFSCTIDGVAYESLGLYAYAIDDTDEDAIRIYGAQDNGEGIYIQFPKSYNEGANTFSGDLFSFVTVDGKVFASHFGATHQGTIQITTESTEVLSGTFSFTAYNTDNADETMELKNGKFRVAFRK